MVAPAPSAAARSRLLPARDTCALAARRRGLGRAACKHSTAKQRTLSDEWLKLLIIIFIIITRFSSHSRLGAFQQLFNRRLPILSVLALPPPIILETSCIQVKAVEVGKADPQGHGLLNTWEDSASDSVLAKVLRARQLSHPTARRSSKPCEKVTVVVRDERRAAQLASIHSRWTRILNLLQDGD